MRSTGTVKQVPGRPVLAEQSDPLFTPANLLIMTPRLSREILARNFVAEVQGTSGKALTTKPFVKDLY